jgi:hypothetical protein
MHTLTSAIARFTLRLRPRARPLSRLVCALAFLLVSLASAQALPAQIVRGTLLDDRTGQRIPAGTMSLLTEDSMQVADARTDRGGAFVLQAVRPGSYRLRAEHPGFVSVVSSAMEVKEGDTVRVEVALSRGAIVLNPVVVKARPRRRGSPVDGYHDRLERLPWGTFVTREEIERSHAGRATDLLRRIPGVQVVPAARSVGSNVILRGTCSPTVFVDGSRVPLLGGATIDDLVKPSMLEGIEVYRNATQIPAEYGLDAGCGAILLWSRVGK